MKKSIKKSLVSFLIFAMCLSNATLSAGAFSSDTHEYTTKRGSIIVEETFGSELASFYNAEVKAQLKIYCTKPDEDEAQGSYKVHFYNPATEKNFIGEDDSALSRFTDHYNQAVDLYKKGRKNEAFEQLARSVHFLEDMNTPVHTNNQSFLDSAIDVLLHVTFEKKCVKLQSRVESIMLKREFDYYKNNTIKQIGKSSAFLANDNFYAMYQKIETQERIALNSIENAQKAVAGVFYRFYLDVRGI
ncbi:MAG: Phospholipase C [Eubacteriales bacterium SKADARSKE-1]|nr:Phospholipase C [Eubacteriales bacterium SKADARSKE-1]